MQKMNFGGIHLPRIFSLKSSILFFCLVFLWQIIGCGKSTKYANNQTYDKRVDTATLIIKISNINNLPIDVSVQPTRLLLFDSKNLYYHQTLSKEGIVSKDTSITLNGIPMGHYTALLVVDAPGVVNLNYLTIGKHSYQNVMDTLQYLLTDTYVASTQGIIVNNKKNIGNVNFEPLVSLISQVSFDLSGLKNTPIWQHPNLEKYTLYYLEFQNNTLVRSKPIKMEDVVNGIYQMPVAKGANYSFMFTDLANESNNPSNIDSMINGKTTPVMVQQKLEKEIDQIRMGNVLSANLVKTEQTYKVINSIVKVPIILTGKTMPKDWTTDCKDWNLLIFDQTRFLKRIVSKNAITESPSPKDALVINLFKGNHYTLVQIGNATGAVGKYQVDNENTPITPEYVLNNQGTNLQNRQDELYAWVAADSGIISGRLINEEFKMIPEIRLSFKKMATMTIAEVRNQTGNYFAENPRKITGVITSIGKVEKDVNENPIPNLIILQDGQNAAIPISFKNSPNGLKIGNQITIALQDGEMTTSNTNANNILVLEKATYTEVETQSGVALPEAKKLTLAEAIDDNTYKKYESVLVEINDLEFKWFSGLDYGRFSADSTILRDNNKQTAPATSLPNSRKTINMITSKNASVKFAGTPIPSGNVNSIKGFLTKTNSANRKIAIIPRKQTDIVCSDNTLSTRADKGVVAWWGDGGSKSDKVANGGVSREGTDAKMNTKLSSEGGLLTIDAAALYIFFPAAANNSDRGIIFTLNTNNLSKNEDVRLTLLNGIRWGGLSGGFSDLTFDLRYSLDNGNTWKMITNTIDGKPTTFRSSVAGSPATTYSYTGVSSSVTADIKGIGGYDNVQILVNCTGGKTSQTIIKSNDRYWQIYNLKIEQFIP